MQKSYFPLILLCTLFLTSCNNNEKAINQVALGYLNAMGNYRMDEAIPFAAKETQETTISYIKTYIMPQVDTNRTLAAYIKSNTPATIAINNISIDNDSMATVAYTKTTPIQHQDGNLRMVKRDNKWQALVLMTIPNAAKVASKPIQLPDPADIHVKAIDSLSPSKEKKVALPH